MTLPYPQKETPAQYPINPLIAKRWSAYSFSEEPVEHDKLFSLFEVMRWAPSSRNEQPWRVVYATKDSPEDFERIASLLDEGNQYARRAYMLGVICAVQRFSRDNKQNAHSWYDTGSAIENLFLQAVSLDLIAHVMSGFDRERAYTDLGIPRDDALVVAMVAVGYPGDPAQLNEKNLGQHNAPRKERRAIEDFAFKGVWKT